MPYDSCGWSEGGQKCFGMFKMNKTYKLFMVYSIHILVHWNTLSEKKFRLIGSCPLLKNKRPKSYFVHVHIFLGQFQSLTGLSINLAPKFMIM